MFVEKCWCITNTQNHELVITTARKINSKNKIVQQPLNTTMIFSWFSAHCSISIFGANKLILFENNESNHNTHTTAEKSTQKFAIKTLPSMKSVFVNNKQNNR